MVVVVGGWNPVDYCLGGFHPKEMDSAAPFTKRVYKSEDRGWIDDDIGFTTRQE
jgi:hypothetical protein